MICMECWRCLSLRNTRKNNDYTYLRYSTLFPPKPSWIIVSIDELKDVCVHVYGIASWLQSAHPNSMKWV